MIKTKLKIIEEYLQKLKAPVIGYLNEPAQDNEVIQFFKKQDYPKMPVCSNVIDIYLWHNGTNINYEESAENFYLFPTFYLTPFEDIEKLYSKNVLELCEKKMLPFFSSGHGEFLAFDLSLFCEDINKTPIYQVEAWNPLSDTYTQKYDNINSMLDTVIECYKQKLFYIKDGILDFDFDEVWRLSKEMNPQSKYWK